MNVTELRSQATEAERLARLVSYRPDKERLLAKAAELRQQADQLEQRSWRPPRTP